MTHHMPPRHVTVPVTVTCIQAAADRYRVPVALLYGILSVENGRVGEVSHNRDGSDDLGPMQVNSRWLPVLARYGVRANDVRDNGCVNVAVGAWILSRTLTYTTDPVVFWQSVGRYHSSVPALNKQYSERVWRAVQKLFGVH